MENIKNEIIKILIANQEKCKIGSDGDYSTELCVFADDFDLLAETITSFIQAITDTENQPNQFGIDIFKKFTKCIGCDLIVCENPNLPNELFKQPEIYFNSLGFESCGQYEWKNNIGWVIEYMGTTKRPNCWRIDDFSVEGHQILFIDLKDKKDLEWFLNSVNVNIA